MSILDAKWKRLDLSKPNSGVSSSDAYQMNAYASRYRCNRLALVYPSSEKCSPGGFSTFALMTEGRPMLEIFAVDVRELAFGSDTPGGLEKLVSELASQAAATNKPYAQLGALADGS
jgi:5-methylcytosine-specific restriction enzyme subunit McrC